jgi:hypothetical protein
MRRAHAPHCSFASALIKPPLKSCLRIGGPTSRKRTSCRRRPACVAHSATPSLASVSSRPRTVSRRASRELDKANDQFRCSSYPVDDKHWLLKVRTTQAITPFIRKLCSSAFLGFLLMGCELYSSSCAAALALNVTHSRCHRTRLRGRIGAHVIRARDAGYGDGAAQGGSDRPRPAWTRRH